MATTSSTSVSSAAQGTPSMVVPQPTEAQQRVLDRIAAQRERLRSRRAARAQAMALSQHEQGMGAADESLVLRAAGFAREHPLVVAAVAVGAVVAGPRRLIRWAGVVLPLWMRLRRR